LHTSIDTNASIKLELVNPTINPSTDKN